MNRILRMGIMGTGNIARQFAAGVGPATRCRVTAVGSRKHESADAFAAAHHVPTALGSYEALLESSAVDAVYVSLPNSMHHEWTIRALRAGKHVLCEKPFASNAAQAREMFDVARQQGLVLTEAFMYRSHPLMHAVTEAVASGRIGRLQLIRTSFCFRVSRVRGNIRFDPTLAGGALMDVGCYCINFSRLLAGAEPSAIHCVGRLHESGVDELAAAVLQFPNGVSATFSCGMSVQADNTAYVCGTDGYIEIPVPWKPAAQNATWTLAHSTPPKMDQPSGSSAPQPPPRETFSVDAGKPLYALEADDFAEAILDSRPLRVTESDTLGNMRVLDETRRQLKI